MAADGAASDYFGFSAAFSGDSCLVGATFDHVGGNADQGSCYVFLPGPPDTTPPTTTASGVPATWAKTATITLTASDDLSGVASTEYRLQGAASWTAYGAPFPAPAGASTYEYRSTDVAGNVETPAKTFLVRIDDKKPTTTAYKASVKHNKKVSLRYKVSDPLGCGSATVTIKIYKGTKLKKTLSAGVVATSAAGLAYKYLWKCTLAKGGYIIKVYATDAAGNTQKRPIGAAKLTVT